MIVQFTNLMAVYKAKYDLKRNSVPIFISENLTNNQPNFSEAKTKIKNGNGFNKA